MKLRKLFLIKQKFKMLTVAILFMVFQLPNAGSAESHMVNDVQLEEAFYQIGQKYRVFFNYDRAIASNIRVEYHDDQHTTLEESLSFVLKNTNLNYKIFDQRYVVVYQNDEAGLASLKKMINHFQGIVDEKELIRSRKTELLQPLYALSSLELNRRRVVNNISGIVTDQSGQPLIGVNVLVKGENHGTATDFDGIFKLEDVNENAILVFSYIGYQSQEVALNGRTNINVTLIEDSQTLDEVVVVGYGTRVKGALTGAISTADEKIFEARPQTNTLSALQGALPGVTIQRGSGRPGNDDFSLQIRGVSSIGGNKPLVLIDGIPGDLNLINPNDIKNITVLKDAAASIYGARAADGVVLITTKKGNKGDISITYSANFGIKSPEFLKRMTNTQQLVEMYDEGMRNIGAQPVPEEVFDKIASNAEPDPVGWLWQTDPGFYQSTDWTDLVYGNGLQQMHNVTIAGGGEKNNFHFSAGYNKDEGILNYGENNSKRYNLRLNYDYEIADWLKLETRNSFDRRGVIEPSNVLSAMSLTPRIWSFIPAYNPSGQLYRFRGWLNPIVSLQNGEAENNYSKFSSNFKLEGRIGDDLKIVSQVGFNLGFGDTFSTFPTFANYDWYGEIINYSNDPNRAENSNSKLTYSQYNLYLDYNKEIDNHNINFMAGTSYEKNVYRYQIVRGANFLSNELFTMNLADKSNLEYMDYSESLSDWALRSYFARIGYSFNHKFYVDLTTRIDGSSKFSSDKRWSAIFPAVSASWNLFEEDFIKSMDFFDVVKLRASWGQTGNQELSFGNYDYIPLISLEGAYPLGEPNVGLQGARSSIASSTRTWEIVETANIGVDFAIFNSKLYGSLDYFVKINDNMLVSDELPAVFGGVPPTLNIGKLRTNGWDLSLGWNGSVGDLYYNVSAMVSDNRNKLLELKGNDTYSEGLVRLREGYSINSYFGFVYDGIIQNEEELIEYKKLGNVPHQISVGDVKYKDIDGDGQITAFGDLEEGTNGDMEYLGNLLPRFTYSTSANLTYKNFEFSVFLQGVGKREGIRTGDFSAPFRVWWYQPLEYFYQKTWTEENPNAQYPRIIPGGKGSDELRNWNWAKTSSLRMNDLSYLRVKLLTLSYNLPKSILENIHLESVRVYFSGQDLFTFSKGTWGNSFDPEENWQRQDEQTYPFSKVYSLGFDIKF